MKGHIRKRGDAWELRVYVGVDAVTGKKRYATKSIRGGKRDAERALVELAADAQRGKLSRTNTTVAELLDAWFDQASQDFSPKTVVETRGFIERNLRPALGTVPLTRLKAADLDRYYTRLLKNGGQSGQPLSPATIRRIHGILRRALQQAVRWGWIGANPAASATPPRVNAPEIRPPRRDEVAKLFRAVGDDPEFAAYLMLSAVSGARRSEVIALRWTDIDLEHASMTIRRAIVVGPNGLVEKDTKTHSVRRVALDAANCPDARRLSRLHPHPRRPVSRRASAGLPRVRDRRRDAHTVLPRFRVSTLPTRHANAPASKGFAFMTSGTTSQRDSCPPASMSAPLRAVSATETRRRPSTSTRTSCPRPIVKPPKSSAGFIRSRRRSDALGGRGSRRTARGVGAHGVPIDLGMLPRPGGHQPLWHQSRGLARQAAGSSPSSRSISARATTTRPPTRSAASSPRFTSV